MTKIGYILIAVGFLYGAYLTSLDPQLVQWGRFLPTLLMGFVGVALVRMGTKQESQAEHKIAENIGAIEKSIANIVAKTTQLDADKNKIHTYDMRHKVDKMLIDDLNAFVDARETIGHVYGLQAYADVMSHYAAGERYLNRVWSASADGYIDEVNEYIAKAADQFRQTQDLLNSLHQAK
ncbi:MAG: hypothetical protein KDI38_08950 [Calditrichaeota bacterium]|nr:hypothetical protein [Calditrichota bacterium]MCB9090402.1 hypothetical protein [Calditrichia bacterium]